MDVNRIKQNPVQRLERDVHLKNDPWPGSVTLFLAVRSRACSTRVARRSRGDRKSYYTEDLRAAYFTALKKSYLTSSPWLGRCVNVSCGEQKRIYEVRTTSRRVYSFSFLTSHCTMSKANIPRSLKSISLATSRNSWYLMYVFDEVATIKRDCKDVISIKNNLTLSLLISFLYVVIIQLKLK